MLRKEKEEAEGMQRVNSTLDIKKSIKKK